MKRQIQNTKIGTVLFMLLFTFSFVNVQAYNNYLNYSYFHFRTLSIDDKCPHTDANCVVQDKVGFIWIGTYSGLACYDGYSVRTYYNEAEGADKAYSNRIFDIDIDEDGFLWMATSAGIQLFDTNNRCFFPIEVPVGAREDVYELEKILISVKFSRLFVKTNTNRLIIYKILPNHHLEKQKVIDIRCHSLWKGKDGCVWVGTDNGCLCFSEKQTIRYFLPEQIVRIEGRDVFFAFAASENEIWLATKYNMYLCQTNKSKDSKCANMEQLRDIQKLPVDFSLGTITDIVKDRKDYIWVSSTKGLFLLRNENGKFIVTKLLVGGDNNNLSSDYIIRLYIDRSDNLFVATYAGGVNILDLQQKAFYLLQYRQGLNNTLSEAIIRSVADSPKYLWIGTNSMGLNRLNKFERKYTVYKRDNSVNSIGGNAIRALLNDGNKYLWVGHERGLDRVDLRSESFSCRHMNKDFRLPEKEVTCLAKDQFGQIWVGTWDSGVCCIRKQGGEYCRLDFLKEKNSNLKGLSTSRIIAVYADTLHPDVFYSSGKQLVRLLLDSKGNVAKSYIYRTAKGGKQSLNSNFVCAIRRENDSILWVGTLGGGINKITLRTDGKYVTDCFTDDDGLNLKDVECLEIDAFGNIWAGGNGLVKYSPKCGTFQDYSLVNGKNINGYKIGGSCVGENGDIYMAGIRGITSFDPVEIRENTIEARPWVSFVSVNNQEILAHNQIALTYKQNNFTVSLTALHYANPMLCKFKYRLIGYDEQWKSLPPMEHVIHLANLPYKKFLLEVKATNNDGKWSPNIYSLPIVVSPPLWLTVPAKILYILFGISTVFLIYVYLLRWSTLKNAMEIKELKLQHDKKIQEIRYQFFTNISHEFRNPLTLILGIIEKMRQENILDRENCQMLVRNVKRLLKLVDDVMDFKKIENDEPKLYVQKEEIYSFIRYIAEDFKNISFVEHKKFVIHIPQGEYWGWIDKEAIAKIVLNLLNNAFKYSKENSTIELNVLLPDEEYHPAFKNEYTVSDCFSAESYFRLYVRDNGVGIPKNSLKDIFTRYYQIHDSEADTHMGSGIGLALVKSLVLQHKGELIVSSELHQGTDFYLSIPCSQSCYSEDEQLHQQYVPTFEEQTEERTEDSDWNVHISEDLQPDEKRCILVVEDDDDVRQFLVGRLRTNYQLVEASNGTEALQKMSNGVLPDLVISDLMMPGLEGNELCLRMKENVRYNSIPFILLTANKSQEAQITGVQSGADAYLNKPISIHLLETTIVNLLESRKRIQNFVSINYLSTAVNENLQNKDKEFYNLLIATIEKNLQNADFDVNELSEQIGYSRTRLYNKVRQTTGMPIKELIRLIRIRKAAQLMTEEGLPIPDVLLRIGIQSQSYFTVLFKKVYGQTPAAFVRELKHTSKTKK